MRRPPTSSGVSTGLRTAAAYRSEVGILWGVWMVALALLVFAAGWIVWVAGLAALVGLVVLARPLQRRAALIVPDDTVPAAGPGAFRKSERDGVLRELAFGEAPLRGCGLWAGVDLDPPIGGRCDLCRFCLCPLRPVRRTGVTSAGWTSTWTDAIRVRFRPSCG